MRLDATKINAIDQAFYDNGVLANSSTPVTVTVTRSDGSVLVADAATSSPATGVYRYSLQPQAQLDRLRFVYSGTWSAGLQSESQIHDLVGGFFISEAEARTADPTFSAASFSVGEVWACREMVEDAIEGYVARALGKGVAFVPRFRQLFASGAGLPTLSLPDYFVRSIRAARIAGVAVTSTQLADLVAASGELASTLVTWPRGMRNVELAYEHGLDEPPPLIRRAALLMLKEWLPAFKQTSDQLAAARGQVRSLRLDGVGLSFGAAGGSMRSSSSGVAAADDLLDAWLASPPLASVPVV